MSGGGGEEPIVVYLVLSCCRESPALFESVFLFFLIMPGPHAGKRKALSLDMKREVIKRKEAGQGNSAIGRDLKISESTVRTIWKKKDEILAAVKAYGSAKFDSRKRMSDPKVI